MSVTNSMEQIQLLTSVRTGADIKSMSLVDEFEDDHITCATAIINDVQIDLFWCGGRVVGALEISDSEQAKDIVAKAVVAEACVSLSCMFDMCDEELAEEVNNNRDKYELVLEYIRSLGEGDDLYGELRGLLESDESTVISKDFQLLI